VKLIEVDKSVPILRGSFQVFCYSHGNFPSEPLWSFDIILEINNNDITTKRIFFPHATSCSGEMWVLRSELVEFDVLRRRSERKVFRPHVNVTKRKEGQIKYKSRA
jgi:hypothetical protein